MKKRELHWFLMLFFAMAFGSILTAQNKIIEQTAFDGGKVRFDGTFYDFRAGDGIKLIKIWVPPDAKEVKGAIVSGHGGGTGDSRNLTRDLNIRQFAARIDFAVIGLSNFPGRKVYSNGAEVFVNALDDMAELGVHPELANIPFIFLGSSNGGATAYGFANYIPERTICFTTNVMAGFVPAVPSDEVIKIPSIMVVGPYDPLVRVGVKELRKLIESTRERGSRWSWVAEQGKGHEDGQIMDVFMTFYKNCIKYRYPEGDSPGKGKVRLKTIPEDEGWLADHDSWKDGITYIDPYHDYTRDKSRASWIIDKDVAYLYRAMATYDNPVSVCIKNIERTYNPNFNPYTMFDVGGPVVDPGKNITLVCNTKQLPEWDKIEFYNASSKLGEVMAGEAELTITVQPEELVYSIMALAYTAKGRMYTTSPMHFIVRDPEIEYQTAYERQPLQKKEMPEMPLGSKYINETENIQFKVDQKDSMLIVYALTPVQEKQFKGQDYKLTPFWDLIDEDHDFIHLTPRNNAVACNNFQITISHDAGLKVKSARSASGIYFCFEGFDNQWMNQGSGKNKWINDVVDVMMDCKSSKEICTADRVESFLIANAYAITKTTMQYKINFGGEKLPHTIGIEYGDPWDIHLKETNIRDARELLGLEIDFVTLGHYHKAIEFFIPWKAYSNGHCFNEEPPPGTRLAFTPGYNERDPYEYIEGNGDMLRWLGGDPWWVEGQDAPCPMYWGDLIMGPTLKK